MCCNHSTKATEAMRKLLKASKENEHWGIKTFQRSWNKKLFCASRYATGVRYARGWNAATTRQDYRVSQRTPYSEDHPCGIHLFLMGGEPWWWHSISQRPRLRDTKIIMFLAEDLICTGSKFLWNGPPSSNLTSAYGAEIVVTKIYISPGQWSKRWYKTEVFDDPEKPWLLKMRKTPPLVGKDATLAAEMSVEQCA